MESHSHSSRVPEGEADGGMAQDLVRELLGRVAQLCPDDVVGELGVHFRTLSETVAEYAVRVEALESENRQLQERLIGDSRSLCSIGNR